MSNTNLQDAAEEPTVSQLIEPTKVPLIRLDFLDGIRGLAAFYVVVHHAYLEVAWWQAMDGTHVYHGERLPRMVLALLHCLTFGHLAVDTFIVLSGYCLMLPIVRAATTEIPGGFWPYVKRRARRILPPYYAAMAFSLLVIALIPGMDVKTGVRWDPDLPAFAPLPIISHLLLIHNLFTGLAFSIDYPMWSVATEWQIYFLFPLILLPLAKKWGPIAPIVAGFAIGVVPVWLHDHHHIHHDFSAACPWFIGLFATGMLGATLTFDPKYATARWLNNVYLISCAISGFALWEVGKDTRLLDDWKQDLVFGIAICAVIVYCGRYLTSEKNVRPPLALRLFESKFATGLGIFSYSLYLVHGPILASLHVFLRPMHLSPTVVTAILILVGTPLCVGLAYLFHRAFERPFMRLSSAHQRRTAA